ncbi:mitochondrial chaperone [Podila minutissima]|nr:mitochondrial chaperone [Podila minutissima]
MYPPPVQARMCSVTWAAKVSISRDRIHPSRRPRVKTASRTEFLKKQCIAISTIGWDISLLKTIVQDAMEKFFKNKGGKTCIYTPQPYDNYQNNSESHAPHAFTRSSLRRVSGRPPSRYYYVQQLCSLRKAGKNQEGENNVTLSGILNSLDGITAQEGSVVFMTTDHIWKLTLALIRLGHCNRKLHFEYADEHQVQGFETAVEAIPGFLEEPAHECKKALSTTKQLLHQRHDKKKVKREKASIAAGETEESSDDSDDGSESDFVSDSDYDEDVKGGAASRQF